MGDLNGHKLIMEGPTLARIEVNGRVVIGAVTHGPAKLMLCGWTYGGRICAHVSSACGSIRGSYSCLQQPPWLLYTNVTRVPEGGTAVKRDVLLQSSCSLPHEVLVLLPLQPP